MGVDLHLAGDGGAALDLSIGWPIAPIVLAVATVQGNFDKDLKPYQPTTGSSGTDDWNVFGSVNWYS